MIGWGERIKVKKWLFGLALAIVLGVAAAAGYVHHWLNSPLGLPAEGIEYRLARGESLNSVSRALAEQGLLSHPRLLRLYARLTDRTRVQAGEYRIEPPQTPLTLLGVMNRGEVVLHRVTLVEGWTYRQALAELHSRETIEPTLAGLSRSEQLQRLGLGLDHPEGWFFPDTYTYERGTEDRVILRRAHRALRERLDRLWAERDPSLPYDSPYEALIMASLVERETGAAGERDRIAGVFVRRLEKGMRLQTDPTVIYGMGDQYQGNLTRRNLRQATPYNTYTTHGLPPTPIALPGEKALEAAFHPAPGTALYFVAKGDGTHVFSDTLEEHNRAVRDYQLRRREDYRSSPR